jgi:hypothetical protein
VLGSRLPLKRLIEVLLDRDLKALHDTQVRSRHELM